MSYQLTKDKYLSKTEVEQLMSQLKRRNRNELMIETALYTGARASELLAITKADLDSEHSEIFIRGIKRSRNRTVAVPKALLDALLALPSDVLFDIGYHQFRKIWLDYRPVAKKLHSLRHTLGTQLYEHKKDLKLVQDWLGHKSIANTLVYVDLVDGRRKKKNAINGFF
jgi:integrase/recombinase XerC